MMERLLSDGIEYLFVSNSDNLGATLDTTLLHYFATSGAPFLMEVGASGKRTVLLRSPVHARVAAGVNSEKSVDSDVNL
jgi:hypothetical protein